MKHTVVVSFTNSKGGVLKTTTCNSIANGLANKGFKVLMVDMDASQNNLSVISTEDESFIYKPGIQDLLLSYLNQKKDSIKMSLSEVVQEVKPNLHIITSTIDLAGIELMMNASSIGRELFVKRAFQDSVNKNEYDFIFFDLAPSLSQLSINCFCASDLLIVPCACTYLSYKGLTLLESSYMNVKDSLNPNLRLYGVIATLSNRTSHSKEIENKLRQEYNVLGTVSQTVKGMDVIYQKEKNIIDALPNSKLANEYMDIVNKISADYKNNVI